MGKETKGMCPLCGAEIATPDKEFIAVAALIGTDSGLGVVYPAMAVRQAPATPSKTAMERIEALRTAGVDVSHLFAMQGANGGECIVSNEAGKLAILNDGDPIFKSIAEQGTVPNRRLFRRWVMAQMFHMLSYTDYCSRKPVGVTEMIHRLGYEYQWKMLLGELNAQMKMERMDPVNFTDRNRWFNAGVVTAMAQDYIAQLEKHVASLPEKKCKGIPYKHVGAENIFVEDLYLKLYYPLEMAMEHIKYAKNAAQLYNAVKKFNALRTKMKHDTPQSKEWVDAYKGAGAFFTMQNLIRFHDCIAIDDKGRCLDKSKSLAFLTTKAEMCRNGKGYCLLAMLKKMLDDNGIDIKRKEAEWRKRK